MAAALSGCSDVAGRTFRKSAGAGRTGEVGSPLHRLWVGRAAMSPQEKVTIDLRGKTADIEGSLSAAQIVAALAEEGYSAVRVGEMA